MAIQTFAPIHLASIPAAVAAFGHALPAVAWKVFFEIGRVARGSATHHQCRTEGGVLVAVASRVKSSGIVDIEIDLGNPRLPARTFTTDEAARAYRRRR